MASSKKVASTNKNNLPYSRDIDTNVIEGKKFQKTTI